MGCEGGLRGACRAAGTGAAVVALPARAARAGAAAAAAAAPPAAAAAAAAVAGLAGTEAGVGGSCWGRLLAGAEGLGCGWGC